jgi:hypothetical protein
MSSRSLAAARARRAGENAPPVSGNRPGTSIGSHAAFAPQQQTPPGYNHNMQPNNVRVGAPNQQQQPQKQQSQKQQSAAYQQVQNSQQQEKQALPFTKLSISDAISLITLRLGRVEQWVIDTENENEENGGNVGSSGSLNLPDNSKIIDSSILNNIISRLDSLEKREPGTNSLEEITKISESVTKLTEQITKIIDEGNKQSLVISKHTEQVFKFDRDLVETKDLLKTFMIRYDMFASETNNKFADYELALSELEKNVHPVEDTPLDTPVDVTNINDIDTSDLSNEIASTIMSVDLKNIIKQELAASSN